MTRPYHHHPASAGAIRSAATTSAGKARAFNFVSGELKGHASIAALNASGSVQAPVGNSTNNPQQGGQSLEQAAYLQTGSLNQFAEAIDTYNKGIDDLNDEYEKAEAADFHVAADAGHAEGNTDAENRAGHNSAIATARGALKDQLDKKLKSLEADLDTSAGTVAGFLSKPAENQTVMLMIAAGYLPMSAADAFPGMDLTVLNTIRKYFSLARTVLGTPDKFLKLYQIFATSKDLAKTAAELAKTESQWATILRSVEKNFSTTTRAALSTYMQSRQEISAMSMLKTISEAKSANAAFDLVEAAKATGKIGGPLAVLGVATSAYDLFDLFKNGNDGKGTGDAVLRGTGDVLGLVSSGGGLLAAAGLLSLGPVGAGVLIGAGLVSAGIAIYRNWDEISALASAGTKWVGDRLSDAGEWAGDRLEDAGDWAGDRVDDIGEGLDNAKDAVGDAWDAVTPW